MRAGDSVNMLSGVLCSVVILSLHTALAKNSYKICVPKPAFESCLKMTEAETKSKTEIECVAARDRVECLSFVLQRQADFVPADPEDMYVASKMPNQDFTIFQEYRTAEEPDAPYRYEAVMVVRNSLPVTSLEQLRGLKSCHTGVGRNVGYKIPLTMLMRLGILPPMNDKTISPRENELKALTQMFKKSCIVGDWSPDPKTTTQWKSKYSNLCALCEHPSVCDYPDIYSGYEGALRCLAHNGGEVAFTKVIYVRKFFGLPVGTVPASKSTENPDEFSYLCVDGTKVPVREKACSWAARPWQALMGHQDVLASLSPLKQKMKQLADIGAQTNATWFYDVLGMTETIHNLQDNIPLTPTDYLDRANYTVVIERGHGPPEPTVRLCVTTELALSKCRTISTFAFSRDIRPRLDCVLENTIDDCLETVRDNGADFTAVDGNRVAEGSIEYNLHPVFEEVYGQQKNSSFAVAVVKKGGQYNNLEGLRGKRSCHSSFGSFEGTTAPLYLLIKAGLVQRNQCPRLKYMAEFFGGSCLPGANDAVNDPAGENPASMTKQCASKGDNDALKCLTENRGDVAFVSSRDLAGLDDAQYELLCLNKQNGGRAALTEFMDCHVSKAPSRTWLAAQDFVSDVSIAHTPLSLASMNRSDLLNIFGTYWKNNNIIFNNYATGLVASDKEDLELFKTIHNTVKACQ